MNPFNSSDSYTGYLAGQFLIAQADLRDPNFFRTVVLVTEHNAEGAFGLVINRNTEFTLGEVVSDLSGTPAGEIPVLGGGPVGREYLFVLHAGLEVPAEGRMPKPVAPGLVFEPLTEPLLAFLKETYPRLPDAPAVRAYVGYAGWGPGQLENEYRYNSWYSCGPSADLVFSIPVEEVWENTMSRLGPLFAIIAKTGYKPSLN